MPKTPEAVVPVALGARSYDILIGDDLLQRAGTLIKPHLSRGVTATVTDSNVARHHLATLEAALKAAGIANKSIILPAGEGSKSFTVLAQLCDQLLSAGIERKDMVIALGGGVIGDLAGFAAAILRRGVRYVQIPTSLLAQVDSSVGGKTGINSSYGKNLVGAFHQPSLVLADQSLLATLPKRERAAGYAEVVKYGLLGDAKFFDWLDQRVEAIIDGDRDALARAVETSCKAKARIVAEDETETGVRALLNLGHTFGHALEAATGYSQTLLHGEAVAIGLVQAFKFSACQGLCDPRLSEQIARHLGRAGLPTRMSQVNHIWPDAAALLEIMRQDKKASGGKLTFILARGIGQAFIAKDVSDTAVLEFLKEDMRKP